MLNKGNGKKTAKAFRPITLSNFFYKIISNAISFRLKNALRLSNILPDNILAYRQGLSPHDAVQNTLNTINIAKKCGIKLALLQTDFSKAYDCVSRRYIFDILKAMNFPSNFIEYIKNTISNNFAFLNINSRVIGQFELKAGLAQGCTLSVLLFNLSTCLLAYAIKTEVYTLNIPRTVYSVGERK